MVAPFLGVIPMTEANYDATLDARTGRPVLPLDTENARKAEAESQPLTDEDNQGISMGNDDEDSGETDANNDMPHSGAATQAATPSSVDINSTVPRMRAAEPDTDEQTSDVDEENEADELIDETVVAEETIEGERPEALAKFAEVARNDDGKPVRNGVEATSDTAPIPTDPALKQDAATRVLREGVLGQDQGADQAINRLPDRTDAAERHHRDQ